MATNSMNLSCSCGANMVFSENFTEPYFSHVGRQRDAFLKAHAVCRTKATEIHKQGLLTGERQPEPYRGKHPKGSNTMTIGA